MIVVDGLGDELKAERHCAENRHYAGVIEPPRSSFPSTVDRLKLFMNIMKY